MSTEPTIQPMTATELQEQPTREFVLLAGKDGTGKTTSIISLASYVAARAELFGLTPPNFYIIDTESSRGSGFVRVFKGFGPGAPKNILYFPCESIQDVLDAFDTVMTRCSPGEWLAVESMSAVWELAQNAGYLQTTGTDKQSYLKRMREHNRRVRESGGKRMGPIQDPDNFWNVVKDMHDGNFLNVIRYHPSLNVVMTTTVKRLSDRQENKDRREFVRESGIDMGLEGLPKLPYIPDTVCYLEMLQGKQRTTVLKDRGMMADSDIYERVVFQSGRRDWGQRFHEECRAE